jgi:hypothetical protein
MSLFDDASLVLTPNGYKASKLYSIKPTSGAGDMVVSRATTATRVNSSGLIELMPINVPRLDYTGGGCPSILVEPLRTNLVLQSQTLDNASWSKSIGGSGIAPVVTANAGTAPDGTMTADRVQFNCVGSLSADRSILLQGSLGTTIATRYYQSIYVKAFSSGEVGKKLRIASDGLTGLSSVITITADWQRIVLNGLASTATTNFIVETRGTFTTPTNTTADVLLWGAQVEAGSNETSYIPTTTLVAGTTRNADVITKTGVSSLIGQAEGTIFWDVKDLAGPTSSGNLDFGIRNTGFTNSIAITTNTLAQPFRVQVKGTSVTLINYTSAITTAKACVKYGTFGAKLFLNGNPTPVATTPTNPNFSSVDLIDIKGTFMSYKTNSFALWTTALTDAQCISLTTP